MITFIFVGTDDDNDDVSDKPQTSTKSDGTEDDSDGDAVRPHNQKKGHRVRKRVIVSDDDEDVDDASMPSSDNVNTDSVPSQITRTLML